MASIRKRINPSGATAWICDFTDQFGKRRVRQFKTKRKAEAFLADAISDIRTGSYVHAAKSPRLEANIEEWLKHCKRRVGIGGEDHMERATYEDYRGKVRNHILSSDYGLGHMKVNTISSGAVDEFRLAMIDPEVRGRSPPNATKTVAVLRAYLSWAQDRGLIATNPLLGRKYRGNRREETKTTPPSHEVIRKLLEVCPSEKELYLRFAILTGFRASEQRALRWRYADLEKQLVEVHERVDKYQKVAPPKSSVGYRTVPIGPQLSYDLLAHKVGQGATIDDLVFPGPGGDCLRHDVEMKSWFEPLREKIEAPKLRWHDLRHYAISCWIEAGLNPKVVQTRAGHSSIQITYDRYGHLLEKQQGGEEMAGIEARLHGS